MRQRFEPQLQIGQVDIADIQFDLRSRDEIPKILIVEVSRILLLKILCCAPEKLF